MYKAFPSIFVSSWISFSSMNTLFCKTVIENIRFYNVTYWKFIFRLHVLYSLYYSILSTLYTYSILYKRFINLQENSLLSKISKIFISSFSKNKLKHSNLPVIYYKGWCSLTFRYLHCTDSNDFWPWTITNTKANQQSFQPPRFEIFNFIWIYRNNYSFSLHNYGSEWIFKT